MDMVFFSVVAGGEIIGEAGLFNSFGNKRYLNLAISLIIDTGIKGMALKYVRGY